MHCTHRDQDILLLQHGELPLWQAVLLRQHIALCPHCQEKSREYAETSRLIAGAIRQDGGMLAWALKGKSVTMRETQPVLAPAYRPAFALTAGVVAAILAAGVYAYNAVSSQASTSATGTVFRAAGFSSKPPAKPLDASGNKTIFPYSTPVDKDDCVK